MTKTPFNDTQTANRMIDEAGCSSFDFIDRTLVFLPLATTTISDIGIQLRWRTDKSPFLAAAIFAKEADGCFDPQVIIRELKNRLAIKWSSDDRPSRQSPDYVGLDASIEALEDGMRSNSYLTSAKVLISERALLSWRKHKSEWGLYWIDSIDSGMGYQRLVSAPIRIRCLASSHLRALVDQILENERDRTTDIGDATDEYIEFKDSIRGT